ncbi:Transcriptional regulatory protein moc3 [Schizosaccharomyces pombe]
MNPYVSYPEIHMKRNRTGSINSNPLYIPNPNVEPTPKPTKRRTKTGCLTCRRRRIKCDETKPFCLNCTKTNRECEGYPNSAAQMQAMGSVSPPELSVHSAQQPLIPTSIASSSAQTGDTFSGSSQSNFNTNDLNQMTSSSNLSTVTPIKQDHQKPMNLQGFPSAYQQHQYLQSNHNVPTNNSSSATSSTKPSVQSVGQASYPFLSSVSNFPSNFNSELFPFYFHDVVPSICAFEFDNNIALHFWSVTVPQFAQSMPCIANSLMAFASIKKLDVFGAYSHLSRALRCPMPGPNSFEYLLVSAFLTLTQLNLPAYDLNFCNNFIRKLSWSSSTKSNYVSLLIAMVVRELVFAILPRGCIWGFNGKPLSEVSVSRNHAPVSDSLFTIGLDILSQPTLSDDLHRERMVAWRDEYHVHLYSASRSPLTKVIDCVGHAVTKNNNDVLSGLQQLMQEECTDIAVLRTSYLCVLSLQNVFASNSKEFKLRAQIESHFGRLMLEHFMNCNVSNRPVL